MWFAIGGLVLGLGLLLLNNKESELLDDICFVLIGFSSICIIIALIAIMIDAVAAI